MDRDYFIITVYCLVCEQYRAILATRRLRKCGFEPAQTDEEVITRNLWRVFQMWRR